MSEPNIVPLIDVLARADHHLHGDHADDADGLDDSGSSAPAAESRSRPSLTGEDDRRAGDRRRQT